MSCCHHRVMPAGFGRRAWTARGGPEWPGHQGDSAADSLERWLQADQRGSRPWCELDELCVLADCRGSGHGRRPHRNTATLTPIINRTPVTLISTPIRTAVAVVT